MGRIDGESSSQWFTLRYQADGVVREIRAQLPRWFIIWIVITVANAAGLAEPAKMLARHVFGIAGCG